MRARLSVLLAAVILGGCFGEGGEAPQGDGTAGDNTAGGADAADASFSLDATGCRELLGAFLVPASQARAFVPTGYDLFLGPAGQAVVIAGLKECVDALVDGSSIGPASTSDVGVLLDMGDPSVFHYYQTWWHTDNALLDARLRAGGWGGALVNDTLTRTNVVVAGATWAVADPDGPYGMTGTFETADLPLTSEAVGWHDTPNGTVRVLKTLAGSTAGTGQATLSASGPMADLAGEGTRGVALWNEYGMSGRVERA